MIRQNHTDGYNLRSPYVIGLHDAKFSYPGKPWTFLFLGGYHKNRTLYNAK